MANFSNIYDVELTKGPVVTSVKQMFLNNKKAQRIGANVYENGVAVTLGGSCSGTVVRADGGTVGPIAGTVSGNTCYIDLPQTAYAIAGPVQIYLTWVGTNTTTTLVAAFGNVQITDTGTTIDPGTVISDVNALISAINTAVSSIPADYSALWTTLAAAFSTSTDYKVGDYVTYNGAFYMCTATHAAGSWDSSHFQTVKIASNLNYVKSMSAPRFDSANSYAVGDYVWFGNNLYKFTTAHTGQWNSSHVTQVALGNEVGELKSAFNQETGLIEEDIGQYNYYKATNVELIDVTGSGAYRAGCDCGTLPSGTYVLYFKKQSGTTGGLVVTTVANGTYTQSDSIQSSPFSFTLSVDSRVIVRGTVTSVSNWNYYDVKLVSAEYAANSIKSDIDYIGSVVGQSEKTFTWSSSAAAGHQFEYRFYKGHQYSIKNDTSATITFQTRETQSGSTVENLGNIGAGYTKKFTATADAYWFNSWLPATGSIVIGDTSESEMHIDEIDASIESIDNAIYNIPTVFTLSSTASSSRQFEYEFHAGSIYAIANNTTSIITFQTRETQSGSAVDDAGSIGVGYTKKFTATADAHWFNSWCPDVGNITILEIPKSIIEYVKDKYNNILAAIAPPQAQPYVSVETVTGGVNVIFPADTAIYAPYDGTRYTVSSATTVFCQNTITTAFRIYYNPTNSTFTAAHYSTSIPIGCIFIAAVRTIPATITITCPYKVDGLPFGEKDVLNTLQNDYYSTNYHKENTTLDTALETYTALFGGDTVNNVAAVEHCEPFLFFTDPHTQYSTWSASYGRYMLQIQQAFRSAPFKFALSGGDWLGNSDTPAQASKKLGLIGANCRNMLAPCYMLVGNHDTNYQGKKDASSATYTTKLPNASISNLWYQGGNAYYTFDGENTKFYAFDTGIENQTLSSDSNYGTTQCAWFANALLTDNSNHIGLAFHMYYSSYDTSTQTGTLSTIAEKVLQIASAYNNRTTITFNSVTYDYSSATGFVEFAFAGHTHRDITVRYTASSADIPIIITEDVGKQNSYPNDATFDLVFVDYDNRKIKCIRVGDGSDREVDLASRS